MKLNYFSKLLSSLTLLFLLSSALFALTKSELKKMDPLLQRAYHAIKKDIVTRDDIVPIIQYKDSYEIPVFIKSALTKSDFLKLDIKIGSISGNIATAYVSPDELERLLQNKDVIRIEPGTKCYPLLDVSTSDDTTTDGGNTIYVGNNADGVQLLGYSGEGVITSVIDPAGINFNHEDFQLDGDTRVLYLWDQTTGESGSNHPTGFSYGTEYDSEDIDGGSCSQTAGAHGNNCIGIMAGNGAASSGTYKAMAPESDIVYVKCSSSVSSTYLQDGIDYIFGKASSLGKPAIVSISLGSQYGPHDGTSLRNEAIDDLCGSGKIVCFACGNSGSKRIHADASITQGSSHTFDVDVIADDFGLDIWFSGDDILLVYVDPPNLTEIGPINFEDSYEQTTTDGIIEVYNCTDSPSNNDHHIVVYVSPDEETFATGTWSVRLYGQQISSKSGEVDAWSFTYNNNYFTSASSGNTSKTVNELACGYDPIAVAGFYGGSLNATGVIYSGSGRGPTRDGRQKPDLAGNQQVKVPSYNADDTYSDASTGTSYSSPHVGGAIALLLEKYNTATPSQIKSYLCDYAFTDIYTDNAGEEPNYQVGYGKLNTYSSFDHTLPVILSAFSAIYVPGETNDRHVLITWTTQSETDILGFNILSSDSENFSTDLCPVNGNLIENNGTTSTPENYEFHDYSSEPMDEHYYWLEIVNLSGASDIYGPIHYTPGDTDGDDESDYVVQTILYENFPNPASRTTTIQYQIAGEVEEQHTMVHLYNIKGQMVRSAAGEDGRATLDLNDLQSGIYFYQIQGGDKIITKRMIILHE